MLMGQEVNMAAWGLHGPSAGLSTRFAVVGAREDLKRLLLRRLRLYILLS